MIFWLIVALGFAALGWSSGDSGAYAIALLALVGGPLVERLVFGRRKRGKR